MSDHDDTDGLPASSEGSLTAVDGTPVAVDVSRDRRARSIWVALLAGPIIWFTHFMVVYLAVEAGCTGDGPGLTVFDPPVPTVLTVAATVVAAIACLWSAVWALRRWRVRDDRSGAAMTDDLSADLEYGDRNGLLSFVGFLLSSLSVVAILMVGLPALVLPAC
jgi:hypothetical protein